MSSRRGSEVGEKESTPDADHANIEALATIALLAHSTALLSSVSPFADCTVIHHSAASCTVPRDRRAECGTAALHAQVCLLAADRVHWTPPP